MNPPFATCEGRKCPSQANCKRYTERSNHETTPAALWIRREPGASACDLFVSSLPSTFEAKPFRESREEGRIA